MQVGSRLDSQLVDQQRMLQVFQCIRGPPSCGTAGFCRLCVLDGGTVAHLQGLQCARGYAGEGVRLLCDVGYLFFSVIRRLGLLAEYTDIAT